VPTDVPSFGDQPRGYEAPSYNPVSDWEPPEPPGSTAASVAKQAASQLTVPDLVVETDIEEAPQVAAANQDVQDAARDALADVIAEPITDMAVLGARLVQPGIGNAVAGAEIGNLSEVLMDAADPARLPAEVVEKVATHLTAHVLTPALGPVGLVVAIFAGKFAGELTHQLLGSGQEAPDHQDAVRAVEIVGTFADEDLGRLAESEPFRDYVSDLVGESIVAILPGGQQAPTTRDGQQAPATGEGKTPTITAVVAVYEVRSPEDDEAVQVRPVSSAAWRCIPRKAVANRWRAGSYVYLTLTDGTRLEKAPNGIASQIPNEPQESREPRPATAILPSRPDT
jgi:hypothetical protein